MKTEQKMIAISPYKHATKWKNNCLFEIFMEGRTFQNCTLQDWETVSVSLGLQVLHKSNILTNS